MEYADFTLDTVIAQFGLQVREDSAFLSAFPAILPSRLLEETLADQVSLTRDISTEKARSEFIVAPMLSEVRRQFERQISVFSGIDFSVDRERGLNGACDFLLSLSPLQLVIQAPVIAVVEAKNDNLKSGLGQCLAEMVAVQTFNAAREQPLPAVYGVVTTGTLWRFLRLQGSEATVGDTEIAIESADQILGILCGMMRHAAGTI